MHARPFVFYAQTFAAHSSEHCLAKAKGLGIPCKRKAMQKLSRSVPKSVAGESEHFYENEILSDFQVRWKATLKEKESASANIEKGIGMSTINPKSTAGKYLVEFASSSTVHGLNHLVAPNRHPIEKLLAVLFVGAALLCLIFLSSLFWSRYQSNATVIVVNNNRDEFRILISAIFICPTPNVVLSKLPEVFKKYDIEHTSEAEEFFGFLGNLTYENMIDTPNYDKVPANKWLEILYDLRKDIPPNLLKENDPYEAWVVTERGMCLSTRSRVALYATINYWKSNNWTVVPVSWGLPSYDPNTDGHREMFVVDNTALISASDPMEVITYGTPMRMVQPKTLQRAIVTTSAIRTRIHLANLRVEQRGCKFYFDGGLETWPVYTRNMCITECRMKVIQQHCNCRPHFARPIEGVNTCNAMQLRCIGRITSTLFLFKRTPDFCRCVPKCNLVTYQIRETEQSDLDDTPVSSSIITLIVELPQVVYYRVLFYSFTDFLTGVGGAAGLFLGASVLSFVEIFYYGSMHLCCYMYRSGKKGKKGKKDKAMGTSGMGGVQKQSI